MALTLRTIELNHDPNSATTSAMNIRRNNDFEVPVPEFDSTVLLPPTESCAAYSIADTERQNVFVRVTFESPKATSAVTFEVRAGGGGIMGALAEMTVAFAPGQMTSTVDFPLSARSFREIGRH